MNSLTPKTIPVLSALAHNYALCDHWFASIPTQTFCNRSFVHAGTSSGYVNNGGGGMCLVNETTTIYDLLEAAGKTWNVFCGAWLLESFTLLTQKTLWKYALTPHFDYFKQRTAMHGAALLTGRADLHERIDNLKDELEADLLMMEHEAHAVKDKIFGS